MPRGAESACRYRAQLHDGTHVTLGFITAMSCNFCAACDRIRIASDGAVYPCLMDQQGGDLLPALRPHFDPERFDRILLEAYGRKAAEHPASGQAVMTHIGG